MGIFSRSGQHQVLSALCYGKLPFYKDFLKSRNGDSSQKFQGWLNGLDRQPGKPAKLPRTQRVLFLPESGKEYVVATVWDSSDEGGVRTFPFALYFEPSRRFLSSVSDRPVLGNLKLWEALEREEPALAATGGIQDFYGRLRGISHHQSLAPPGEGDLGASPVEARGITVKALASAIFGEDPREDWIRLLWRLHLALGPADRSSAIVPTLALRLPLAKGIPNSLQVESWIHFVRRRASNSLPSAIFPRDPVNGPASFCLLFRSPRESDVWLLLEDASHSEVLDLTMPDPQMEVIGFGEFHEDAGGWFERPEAGLWSLLPLKWIEEVS